MRTLTTKIRHYKIPSNKHTCIDSKRKDQVVLKNRTLNQCCTQEQKSLIVQKMNCINYRKGESVFYEGQPSFLIYFVHSGVIKLWKEGLHDHGQIIRFAKEGDMLGFWSSLENRDYTLSATALTDLQLCYIKKDDFLPIVHGNATLHLILHDYIKELKKTEVDLRNIAEMNVREKVANSLLLLLDVFKNQMDDNALNVVLSRREISELASISEDRVSKQLSEFRKEKIIMINDREAFINEKALQQIINSN